ncbi:MAG: signal peptidase I [Pseudomonadota bacterium]
MNDAQKDKVAEAKQTAAKAPPPVKAREGVGEFIRTLIYALLIAVAIRSFTFQPFNIPSGSMIPTLYIGDYLFVSKYAYGFSRYSFPFGPPLFKGRVWKSAPERGDIAVFKWPYDNSTDYIKRVIGLPGDRIQMRGGRLYLNGVAVARAQVADFVTPITPNMPCKGAPTALADGTPACRYAQYRETLPNGRSYMTLSYWDNGENDNTGVFQVPAGHYFMMGDNRDDSSDSRVPVFSRNRAGDLMFTRGVGFVPEANLVGRAEVIFFSTDGTARLWTPWRWVAAMRFERFFNSLRQSDERS